MVRLPVIRGSGRLSWVSAFALAAFALAPSTAAAAAGQFGAEGHGAGQFEAPEGIAVDNCGNGLGEPCSTLEDPSSGDVYVADRNNNRVDKFTAEGSFRLAWGWGVADGKAEFETCGPEAPPSAAECHAGKCCRSA